MNIRSTILLILVSYLGVFSLYGQSNDSLVKYFFTGHTSFPGQPFKVDPRLEAMDLMEYDGIWLGGDLCIATLVEHETLFYLDEIFDLDNPETHWALGNHDYRNGNIEWYEDFTQRKPYYAYTSNKITRIILNTNLVPTQCDQINRQYKIIKDVCDTIQESRHLFLIMHHGLFKGVPGIPNPATIGHSNLEYWNSNCYDVNSNFVNSIYPMLLDVKSRGINVYYLWGDMGAQQKSMDMYSDDSIRFLGCGSYYGEPDDMGLIIKLDKANYNLDVKFHNLDSISAVTNK